MGASSIGNRRSGKSPPPPPPEVHAGDQSVIGDIFVECQLDVAAGDQCSTGDRERGGGVTGHPLRLSLCPTLR